MPESKTTAKKTKTKKSVRAIRAKKAAEKPKEPKKIGRYFEAVGRRKTAIARVRLFKRAGKEFLVNEKNLEQYFTFPVLRQIVLSPLEKMDCLEQFGVSARVKGGGVNAQAEAVRHGIARALIIFNPEFRKTLKSAGFLTRDSRMRERKKFGLKRARRAPQWQKR